LLVVIAPRNLYLSYLSVLLAVFVRGIVDGSLSILFVLLAPRKLSLSLSLSLSSLLPISTSSLALKKLYLYGLPVFVRGNIDGSLSLMFVLLAQRKLSLYLFSTPISSRTVTKIWASRCWEIFLASNLLGESVAMQDTGRVGRRVKLLRESLLVELPSQQLFP
jgi:hypothetical protein